MKTTLFLITILLFAACEHEIEKGKVTQMYIEPARDYIFLMPVFHRAGKVTFTTFIPIPMHDDEDYVLMVDGFTKEGEEKVERFYVTAGEYKKFSLGAEFCVTEWCRHEPNEDIRK